MILTTTDSIEGYSIIDYLGIVSGTSVNAQKIKMTFNMQKYYSGISESISDVRASALEEIKKNAIQLNANAVVGIKIELEISASNFVIVAISGTAVFVVKK